MSNRNKIVPISGVARPSRKLRQILGPLVPHQEHVRIERVMEDVVSIESLATLLTEAIETKMTKDGRIDMKDVAAFVLAEMRKHQR